jgi:hypothetical protein
MGEESIFTERIGRWQTEAWFVRIGRGNSVVVWGQDVMKCNNQLTIAKAKCDKPTLWLFIVYIFGHHIYFAV